MLHNFILTQGEKCKITIFMAVKIYAVFFVCGENI